MFGNRNTYLSINQRLHQLLIGKILLMASIAPVTAALAGSASAPLGVTVTVVRSCNVSTGPALTGRYATPSASVRVLCPRGLDPSIAVKSTDYPVRLTTTEITTRDENKRSLTISPDPSRNAPVISISEQRKDAEENSKGSYAGSVIISVNF
jgi:hypothetical protein